MAAAIGAAAGGDGFDCGGEACCCTGSGGLAAAC